MPSSKPVKTFLSAMRGSADVRRYLLLLFALSVFTQNLFCQSFSGLEPRGVHKDSSKKFARIVVGNSQTTQLKAGFPNNEMVLLPDVNSRDQSVVTKTSTTTGVITIDVTTTNSTCGYVNGSIIAVASGGTPPYTYDIGLGLKYRSGNFPRVSAGTYKLVVTDANGQANSVDVVVGNTYSEISIKVLDFKQASGCAKADASVTLQASGGVPPYEYSMDGVNYQSSNVFTNFYPGFYGLYARDANGCIKVFNSFTLGSFIPTYCSAVGYSYSLGTCANDGLIDAKGLGDNKPYTYSIDGVNYQASGIFSNLKSGMYPVHLKDATGAIQVAVVPIFQYCSIEITYISVDAACQQNDGTLTVTAVNGATPYTYTLDGVNYQSGNVFTNLAPGNYNITVRDANGYLSSLGATVYDRCPTVTLATTNESCAKNDGAIRATPDKGTPPYEYSIDGTNFQSSTDFTGLVAGSYVVTIRDANGFTSTANAVIDNGCIRVFVQGTNAKCGNNNGSISASAANGSFPYQYSIDGSNFQSSGTFNGLAPGDYIITVKDGSGESGTTTIKIPDTPGPTVDVATNVSSCSDNDGSVTISGQGGTLPLSFSIDGTNFGANNTFSNLKSGSYTAYIKDGNACISLKPFTINTNCPLVTAIVTDETCDGKNGAVAVNGSNGTAPYQYSIDGINFTASQMFSSLSSGNYTVTIEDAAGTKNTTSVAIKNVCPIVNANVTDGKCTVSGGVLTAQGSEGYAPYQYSLDGMNFQQSNIFNNLTDGDYTVTIKDNRGLTNTTKATVKNFPSPVMSLTSTAATCLNNDGKIFVTNTSGTSPFEYSIDGIKFQPENTFYKLNAGAYNVVIEDAYGCTDTKQAVVDLNDNLTISTIKQVEVCEGKSVTLTISSNGLRFEWSPLKNINDSKIQTPIVSPSQTTNYVVTATLGVCSKKDSVLVQVNAAPIAVTPKDTTICYGQSVVLSGSGGLNYNWTPSTYLDNSFSTSPVVTTPKSSTTYSLVVSDAKGCSSLNNALVKVTVTPPVKLFAGNDTSIVMNESFQLKAQDINSSGFVNYSWTPSYGLNGTDIQNPVALLDRDIEYSIVATTAAGCMGSDQIALKVYKGPDIFVPNAFTPNNDGRNDILKAIPVGIKVFKYFVIYNRYGEKIFYSSNPNRGWDGNLNGRLQPNGVFVWYTEGMDVNGKVLVRKGTVLLIR